MHFKLLCSSAVLAVILTSCGGSSGGGNSSGWQAPTISDSPIFLTKQDFNCAKTFSIEDEIEFAIQQFTLGSQNYQNIDFGSQVVGNLLKSKAGGPISSSSYGQETFQNGLFTWNQDKDTYELVSSEDFHMGEKQAMLELIVCPTTRRYKEDTFENSGLNISNGITKTYKAVKLALPEIELEQVSLNVVPIIKKSYKFVGGGYNKQQLVFYDTDNAFYDPSEKQITFLPQSEDSKINGNIAPYWEIPMVGAHEYGHHIFGSLVSKDASEGAIVSRGCFESDMTHAHKEFKATEDGERENGFNFAIGSLNEGFADLVAYYALEEQERGLDGVKCFEKNREVGSKIFGDNTKKKFSYSSLYLMNSSTPEDSDSDCETPNHQEIHSVGAMFAHNADVLLSKVTNDNKVKLKIILLWVQELAKEHSKLKSESGGDYIVASLELLYSVALKETTSTQASAKCYVMRSIFDGPLNYSCRYLEK